MKTTPNSYANERSEKRKRARDRIHAQVLHPIDTPSLLRDPLSHPGSRVRGTVDTIKLVAVAAFVHVMIIAVLYAASDLIGESTTERKREVVKVAVVEVPKKKKEPEPQVTEPTQPLVPDFAKEAKEPEPVTETQPQRRKKKLIAKPDPAKETEPSKPPERYRVGATVESTVEGGKGPAIQTGNTRMGKTATTADGPQKGTPTTDGKRGGTGTASGGREGEVREQRKASNIPTQNSVFVKPKRVKPSKAPYPPTLKAQGIEGDVKIRVNVDATGRVTKVVVIGSSGHTAFDKAARRAALKEKFRPATRDGKAVPFTLSYSYRFRIEEK